MSLEKAARPWGTYEKFHQEDGVWIKRIEVNPNCRLSLQKHQYRTEKWIFVKGKGTAVIDNKEIPVEEGSVLHIPLGAVHRIGNTGDQPLVFIEVATGPVLTEEDIIRLQDDFDRK
jgi:mannose-6-phosphate isomerase-like protein (cupin superfamily)